MDRRSCSSQSTMIGALQAQSSQSAGSIPCRPTRYLLTTYFPFRHSECNALCTNTESAAL